MLPEKTLLSVSIPSVFLLLPHGHEAINTNASAQLPSPYPYLFHSIISKLERKQGKYKVRGCIFFKIVYNIIKQLNIYLIDFRKGIRNMKKTYKIEVDCANCANKMEDAAKRTEGVKNATVNFMTLKMSVEFEDGQDIKAVMQKVRTNCKKVEDDCEIFI